MTFKRYGNHPQPAPRGPEPVQVGNGHRVVQASAADIDRWQRDPSTPMYNPMVAASAPLQPAPAADNIDPLWDLNPRFHTPGMKRPPSGYFDIPAVPGSASDPSTSHMGCAAQKGGWQ
jgi:hypothetical protein